MVRLIWQAVAEMLNEASDVANRLGKGETWDEILRESEPVEAPPSGQPDQEEKPSGEDRRQSL